MNSKQGNTTVESVLVFPSFLVVVMFVMELALMWSDRHYMRLAAFEAGRVLSVSENADPCSDKPLFEAAERRAWMRIGIIAPSLTEFLPDKGKIDASSVTDESIFSSAFKYLIPRLPVAYLTTKLECIPDSNDPYAVTVNVKYFRRPALPFARDVMWGLYVIKRTSQWLEDHSFGDAVKLDLDDFYFRIVAEVDLEKLTEADPSASTLKQEVSQSLKFVRTMAKGIDEASAMLKAAGISVPDAFTNYSNFDQKLAEALNDAAKEMTPIVYAVPWQFRVIPMNVRLRMVKTRYRNFAKDWREGRSMMVAPFNKADYQHWREWAEKLNDTKFSAQP